MVLKEDLQKIQLGIGSIVGGNWKVVKRLGEGGCGVVYEVINIKNPSKHAALKAEPFGMLKDDEILKMEVFVLKKMIGAKHVCTLMATGKGSNYSFVIMSLLGRSLSDLRKSCPDHKFTIGTTIHIGIECLEAINELHTAGFVHRKFFVGSFNTLSSLGDIKPSNFSIGRSPKSARTCYIYDFGLARQIMITGPKGEQKLREPRKDVPFKGTIRYCSLNAHRREEHGRHDDLWSLLYMLIEMVNGVLPWRNMEREAAEKCKETADKHMFSTTPREFILIFKHLKKLNYNRTPDYRLIKDTFQQVLKTHKLSTNDPLDWELNGRYGKIFKGPASKVTRTADRTKTKDLNRDIEKQPQSSDLNTRNDVVDIAEKEYVLDDDEDWASHVSGNSAADDTLKKLEDIK